MARIVKDSSVRRNEILDVAQRYVYTKGYQQMTVQDILDELHISKGAFYHYFDSKGALLEALIERMVEEALELVNPIVNDPDMPALVKLQRYFTTVGSWKTAQKTFLLALLRVWYTDDNAIVRQKVTTAGVKQIAPMLNAIIYQGIQEGVFTSTHPDLVGDVVLSSMQGLSNAMAELLLSDQPRYDTLQGMKSIIAAYTDALERILGAPAGSLEIVDAETIQEWVGLPQEIGMADGH